MSQNQFEKMRLDVASRTPEEACGLLSGLIEQDRFQTVEVIPMVNIFPSPIRYRLDPRQQIEVFQGIESAGYELVGIYHSHPQGPVGPSMTDLAEAYYPEVVYLIWSHSEGQWNCRAFTIQSRSYKTVELLVSPDQ
jgi:proteasome lid subunit RPN8/RPN11